MLQNQETGCSVQGVNFNLHNRSHLLRAAQEGIVFSFRYGIDIMKGMGMDVRKIHAGHANMFLSPLFRDTLAGVTGATIERSGIRRRIRTLERMSRKINKQLNITIH